MQADASASAAAKAVTKAKRQKTSANTDVTTAQGGDELSGGDTDTVVGSGRQAAQGMEYKEKTTLSLPDSKITVKQEQIADDELHALVKTASGVDGPRR